MRFSYKISNVVISAVLALVPAGPVASQDFLATGIQAERQGDFTAAEAAYDQGVHVAKEQGLTRQEAASRHRMAVLKAKQGKIRESEDFFRQAVHLDGGNVAMLCDFAKLFSDQKKYADAETVLKNAALAAPDNRRVLYNLGYVVASQENRQTEGLRYLKLALGEARAYRELAKISEDAGKREQAEYARQRAAVLERTEPEPSPESLNSPTVPMDDATRKEITDRIREELLRQEAVEIAEEQQKETSAVRNFESRPIDLAAKWGAPERPSPPPEKAKKMTDAPDRTAEKPLDPFLAMASPTEPVPVTTEEQTKDAASEIETALPQPIAPPAEKPTTADAAADTATDQGELQNEPDILPTLPRIVPLTLPAAKEPEKMEDSPIPAPEIRPVPAEQQTKSSDAELPRTVPSQTGPREAADTESKAAETRSLPPEEIRPESASRIRVLPEPEHRISNSQDALTAKDSTNEISPLPILVLPLDDKPAKSSLPEYTAIGIKRIPSTKKVPASRENAPRFAASERRIPHNGHDPKISLSPNKSTIAESTAESAAKSQAVENQDDISPQPPQLAQPVSLITMESRYPAPRQNAADTRYENALRRLAAGDSGFDERSKSAEKKPPSEATREKSILRPGAGKSWNREVNEEYVYVNSDKPVEEEKQRDDDEKHSVPQTSPPRTNVFLENKTAVRPIAPERVALLSENRLDTAHSRFRRMPEPTPEPAVEAETVVHDTLESLGEERSELQFSSNRAPNVLKFELSQGEYDPFLAMPEPVKKTEDRFQPPTVLKFSPSGESTFAVRKPEDRVEEPLIAHHVSEKPVSPPEEPPFRPHFPVREERMPLRPADTAVSEELAVQAESAEKRDTVRFVPVPRPQQPEPTTENIAKKTTNSTAEVRNLASLPPKNPSNAFGAATFGENPMRSVPASTQVMKSEHSAPLDLSRLIRIAEKSDPPVQEQIAAVQPATPPAAQPIAPPSVTPVHSSEPMMPEPRAEVAVAPVHTPVHTRIYERPDEPDRNVDSHRHRTANEDDNLIGFATSRKTAPASKAVPERPKMEVDVDTILAPQNTLSGLSALTEKTDEPDRSQTGFARSGNYSGTTAK